MVTAVLQKSPCSIRGRNVVFPSLQFRSRGRYGQNKHVYSELYNSEMLYSYLLRLKMFLWRKYCHFKGTYMADVFASGLKQVAHCKKRVFRLQVFSVFLWSEHSSSENSLFPGVPHQHAAEGSICLCCPQDSEPSNEVVSEAPGNVVPSTSRSSSEELVSVAQKHPEEVGPYVSILFQD